MALPSALELFQQNQVSQANSEQPWRGKIVGTILKNAAVVVGVLFLSTIIYFAVSEDSRQIRDDVFQRSLNLLGQQLLSLLPDGSERDIIAGKWQGLVERANRGEVPPEQVERIAVGILNASNLDKQISVEDAEIILDLAFEESVPAEHSVKPELPEVLPPKKVLVPKMDSAELQKKLQEVGKKIEAVCAFNAKIRKSCDTDPMKREVFVQNLRYEIANGIRLHADMNLKHELSSENFQLWQQEIKKLEQEHLLSWREDFAANLAKQHAQLQAHLDSLRAAITMQMSENKISTNTIDPQRLEELKKLEKLQQWQLVDPVRIQKIVYESLNRIELSEPQKTTVQKNSLTN